MKTPCGGSQVVRSRTSVKPRYSTSRGSSALPTVVRSVEQVRLLAGDLRPQRLEGEPAGDLGAHVVMRLLSHGRVDVHDRAGSLGDELHLTGPLHRDEPPDRGVNRLTNGQQAVVAQDDGLVVAEGMRDALALLDVRHDTGVVVEQRM